MKSLKLILAAVLLYSAGVATGVFGFRALVQIRARQGAVAGNGPWQQLEWVRRGTRALDLTPAQREHIDGMVRESQRHLKKLWEPVAPAARAEADLLYRRVLEDLSADEREKFSAWMLDAIKRRPSLTNWWGGRGQTNIPADSPKSRK